MPMWRNKGGYDEISNCTISILVIIHRLDNYLAILLKEEPMLRPGEPILAVPKPFDREEVQELRYRFRCLIMMGSLNTYWKRLYERIEDDLNALDAFIARTEIKE